MDIRQYRNDDANAVANLIARLNRLPQHHICYLGTDPDEIKHSLANSLDDLPAEKAVLVAYDQETLVGVWGLEIDSTRGRCYMWGPFVDHDDWQTVAEQLHEGLADIMPDGTNWFQMGLERENVNARQLADQLGYQQNSDSGYIMNLPRDKFERVDTNRVRDLPETDRPAFAALHDKLFPTTYYSGAEIIERLNDKRRAWVTEDLLGYVYVECKPDHGWASLEFVGVDEAARGKGYGRALVSRACEWLFTHPKVATVDLAVSSDNPAVQLYQQAGFLFKNEICVYQKEL